MLDTVKQQPKEFWDKVGALFSKLIAPYELVDTKRVFVRLLDLADFANPGIPADAGAWAEAIYGQLKQHIHDRPPVFTWVKEPPLVTRHREQLAAQNKRGGGVADLAEAENMGKDHQEQQRREKEGERLIGECRRAISAFFPTKNGRLSYSVQQQVQGVLTKYLDEQLARPGIDMADVARKIAAYIDAEYKKLEPSEKLGNYATHAPWERR